MEKEKEFKEVITLYYNAYDVQFEWLHRIVLLSSTLFGVLIALLPKSQPTILGAVFLGAAIVLLGLGTLILATSLYEKVDVANQKFENNRDNLGRSIKTEKDSYPALAKGRPIFAIMRIIAYILLALAVLSLSAYTIIVLFC